MIGIDLIEVKRIEALLEKYGARFLKEILSPEEYNRLERVNPEEIAGLFAAKEAISKAQGEGIFKMGLRNITISFDKFGKPYGAYRNEPYHISLSHDGGFATAIAVRDSEVPVLIPEEIFHLYPFAVKEDYKGSRGKAAIVGGRVGMIGAAVLAAHSALRSGCGYSYISCKSELLPYFSPHCVEVIAREVSGFEEERAFLAGTDAIGMGPAMGLDGEARSRFLHLISLNLPMVIDADGLRLLAEDLSLLRKRPNSTILTPHLGEMEALLQGTTIDSSNRETIALEFARKHEIILLLKGPNTIVTDGTYLYQNSTGNPGMATAGSGDVLTGIITSLLAQGLSCFEAAKLGSFIHGLAGDIAARQQGQLGMVASDIINCLPKVHKYFENKRNNLDHSKENI